MNLPSPSVASPAKRLVVIGTGGTIAGTAGQATDAVGYRAAQRGIAELIAGVPALAAWPIESEQAAQVDSKDMGIEAWQAIAARIAHHLERGEVQGIVVTHGTDTLEETAWLVARVLAPAGKPVVFTAAMRPATSIQADGPQNLLDAVTVASQPGAHGVLAVVAGRVWPVAGLRKTHTYALDAFDAGDAGPLASVAAGRVIWHAACPPAGEPLGLARIGREASRWPRVEIVASHAGADGAIVDALLAQHSRPLRGLVVAGTGNASLHGGLETALARAQSRGVVVLVCSRVARGPAIAAGEGGFKTVSMTPWQARVELLLRLLGEPG
ncbi:asparaginase [Caldimonas sp. KR1-144]|uniref:asparaginase n=1 Tax=Caldimonas sp. KR1-144 TaxID=3400911 RepID=UPI003C0F621D